MTISEMKTAVKNNLGIIVILTRKAFLTSWNQLFARKPRISLIMRRPMGRDTVLRSPASRRVTEVSPGPRRTAIPRQAFIA